MRKTKTQLIKPRIREILSKMLLKELVEKLPKRWSQIGDVLILPLREELLPYKHEIAKVYAEVLGVKTVLRKGWILGEFREPHYEIIYGNDPITVHKENGILYKLDASRIMFSPANVKERVRMASIAKPNELVVDMFAGIGHLSLPIAKHCKAKVIAIEKNPYTFKFLVENIELNKVQDKMSAYNIDNREFKGENIADRIRMGYVIKTHEFIPKALEIAKDEAIIHYHNTVPERLMPKEPFGTFQKIAREHGYDAELLESRIIKRYSPGVWHVVLDVRVFKK